MDLSKSHELRRTMHVLLAERQAAEAEVVEKCNDAYLAYIKDVVQLVADWLWPYGTGGGDPAERRRVEEAAGVRLDTWLQLWQQHQSLSDSKPRGMWEAAKQRVGITDLAKVERAMDDFLLGLAEAVMADIAAFAGTGLGCAFLPKLQQLEATQARLWADHMAAERAAITSLTDSLRLLKEVVAGFGKELGS